MATEGDYLPPGVYTMLADGWIDLGAVKNGGPQDGTVWVDLFGPEIIEGTAREIVPDPEPVPEERRLESGDE